MKKNKYHYVLAICSLVFTSFCFDTKGDCSLIRNGKFYYFAKKSRERIEVYRQDSLQLETGSPKDGIRLKNRIVWKGDCEFDMFINALSDSPLTGDDSIIARTPVNVKIIHIEPTFYVCVAKLRIFDKNLELRDTLFFTK